MHIRSLLLALLAGCSTYTEPTFSISHPANPRASEAASPSARAQLGRDELTRQTAQRFAALRAVQTNEPPTIQQTGAQQHEKLGAVTEGAKGMQHKLAGARNEVEGKPPKAGSYTCVMHPEVRNDKPGRCPKCGMKLVRGKGASDEIHRH
jgi:hypothetical protein